MKWAREIKVGILSLVVIIVLIWGYEFLKGKNVFGHSNTYKIVYHNIDQLTVSSPVMVRGFKVGMVTDIKMNPENIDEIIVDVEVNGEIRLPRETKAVIYSVGLVGGKGIKLEYDRICDEDCIESGEYIDGQMQGLLSSMVPENEIEAYLNKLQSGIDGMIDSFGFDAAGGGINETTGQFMDIVANLASITQKLDVIIGQSGQGITQSIKHIQEFTGSLKQNEAHLNNVLANLDSISTQLKVAGLDNTLVKVDSTVTGLQQVASSAQQSFKNIDAIIDKVEKGEGSLGKLVSKDSLYNELQLTITHLNLLLQDLRLNPKRYLNVSVIGRKGNEYEKPADDPGLEN
jgi:phospholipid/cholesterol/gamma-HCH transport system substrate-binding protein